MLSAFSDLASEDIAHPLSQERVRIVDQRVGRRKVRRFPPTWSKPPPERDPLPPGGGLGRTHVASPLPHVDEAARVGQLLGGQ